MEKGKKLFVLAVLALSAAFSAMAQTAPDSANFPANYAAFIQGDSTYVAKDNLPQSGPYYGINVVDWVTTTSPMEFVQSKKFSGFLCIPLKLDKFQVVSPKVGGGWNWANIAQYCVGSGDSLCYKKIGVYTNGRDYYFIAGAVDKTPSPNPHPGTLYLPTNCAAFTFHDWMYVKEDYFRGPVPYGVVLVGQKEIAFPGRQFQKSEFDGYLKVNVLADTFQVMSFATGAWGDPGMAVNWIGEGKMDGYKESGVYAEVEHLPHQYWFVPAIYNSVVVHSTAVQNQIYVPEDFFLGQNYPNPFNPSTTIFFSLPKTERIRLCVYNQLGKEIKTLVSGLTSTGKHEVEWNGRDKNNLSVPSGIYIYQLSSETSPLTSKRMLLVK